MQNIHILRDQSNIRSVYVEYTKTDSFRCLRSINPKLFFLTLVLELTTNSQENITFCNFPNIDCQKISMCHSIIIINKCLSECANLKFEFRLNLVFDGSGNRRERNFGNVVRCKQSQ